MHTGDSGWTEVTIIEQDNSIICHQDGPLISTQEVLPVLEVIKTPSGSLVLDFGQNLTGRVRFKVRGISGERVTLNAKEGSYFGATPNDLIATAFYVNSANIISKTAAILNKPKDQKSISG